MIAAVSGLIEELFAQLRLRISCLCYNDEPTGIFVYAMNQPHIRVIGIKSI